MARFIGRTKEGQEIFAYDMSSVEVKTLGENEIEMIGSTEQVDRDNEVLKLDGWELRNYKKNPVVLPAHMYWEPAIGRAKVSIEDKKLMFKIEFPPSGINPVADVYKGLYKGGFMKASSVGFIGLEWQWGEKEGDPRRTFTKQELLEISLVSVPANPNALLTEKAIENAIKAGKLRSHDIDVLKALVKRLFDLAPEKRKIFVLPKVEVKDGDPKEPNPQEQPNPEDDPKPDPKPEGQNPKPEGTPGNPGTPEPEKQIVDIAEKATRDFLKTHKAELIEEVVGIVKTEVKRILAVKGHYSELLKDQVPEGTTESTEKVAQIGEALKGSFKIKSA